MILASPLGLASDGGMRGAAILAMLLLTACGSEPAQVDVVREDNSSAPVASAPIVNQTVGNEQQQRAETAQGDGKTVPAPDPKAPQPERYRALGTEPFWAVTVKGTTAILERPDKQPASFAVSRTDESRSLRFQGNGFTMTVTDGPCSDGMSDAIWSDQVSVAFGEGTLKGCGGDRQDPDDAQF